MPRSTIEAGQRLRDSGFLEQLAPDLMIFNMPITPPPASQPPIMTLASSPATLPVAEAVKPRLSATQKQILRLQERLAQSTLVCVPSTAPSNAARSAEVNELANSPLPQMTRTKSKLPQLSSLSRPKAMGNARCCLSHNLKLRSTSRPTPSSSGLMCPATAVMVTEPSALRRQPVAPAAHVVPCRQSTTAASGHT